MPRHRISELLTLDTDFLDLKRYPLTITVRVVCSARPEKVHAITEFITAFVQSYGFAKIPSTHDSCGDTRPRVQVMRYPQTFIDDLKRQADIVRVVQDYVPLKKKGANWMACCPFHKEKTPSFSVSPAKEIFYCFGCHKGGSVFNFVMEIERVAFPEAIKIVAEKSGVPLPKMVDDSRFEVTSAESR